MTSASTLLERIDSKSPASGEITLRNGRNRLKLTGDLGEYAKRTHVVTLRFSWREFSAGTVGSARIYWRGTLVSSGQLAAYGTHELRLILRNLELPSELLFELHVNSPGAHFPINDESFDFHLAEVSVASTIHLVEDIGLRGEIARAAMATADRFGLRGEYMKVERRDRLTAAVESAIAQRRPFSVVRLGDGEGRILGYPDYFTRAELLTQTIYYHFGPQSINELHIGPDWVTAIAEELKGLVLQSMGSADNIGIPVYDFFRDIDNCLTSGMVGYGCAMYAALPFLPRNVDQADLIGTNVFQQLAYDGSFFPRIAQAAEEVCTVGPWDLRDELSEALGVQNIDFIEVPRHFTWNKEKGAGHFPYLYKVITKKLEALGDLRGRVFFIGAGLLGKHYTHVVKMQGGIALDIGSVFDSWAGEGLPYAVRNKAKINLEALKNTSKLT